MPPFNSRAHFPRRYALFSATALALVLALATPTGAAEVVPEPADYRTNDYRSPVPQTLRGARVLDAAAVKDLATNHKALLVDVYPRAPKPPNLPTGTVWRDPPHESIVGAIWLANVGYGTLAPAVEAYFKDRLAELTASDVTRPLVFFCLRDCWMSWNAAKRALALGYKDVIWFPEGVDAWREADLPLTNLQPLP